MDENKDIVEGFFRDKLKEYESPVRRDLWASLENHVPVEKSLWLRIYPTVASIAAAVIIIILSYTYLLKESPDLVETVASVAENKTQEDLVETGRDKDLGDSEEEMRAYSSHLQTSMESKSEEINNLFVQVDSTIEDEGAINEDLIISEHETTHETPAGESDEIEEKHPQQIFPQKKSGYDSNYYSYIKPKDNSYSELQISFSGKGFLAMSNELDYLNDRMDLYGNKFEIEELFPSDKELGHEGDHESLQLWLPADDYFLRNIKYHTPVTLSLHVSKNVSPRWMIETGISYTKLSSEEIWEAELNYRTDLLFSDIKLYYLGIPLRASYSLIEKDRFFVYLSGGGMIEKCISGKAFTISENEGKEKRTDIKVSELQYSVTGGTGIGLKLFRSASLFVEPGVVYYFDDGSDIMTIRKNKPFNFNIQGGLRFGF